MLDLVIRGGMLVDGTGAPMFRADVGVSDSRIAVIGRIAERARREIDAEGCLVAPGFIEVHTHMDAQVLWEALGASSVWQGITTAVMGNCGFTVAPCSADDKDLCLRSLERAEDMSRDVLLAGIDWRWETFPEYLDVVDGLPKGINYAAMIGHSTIRTYVMGERAYHEQATDDEIELMRKHVEDALHHGAWGFTTSRLDAHRTADDHPVASRMASWDEVCVLASALADAGHGIFQLANLMPSDDAERAAYNQLLGELAVSIGRPVCFPTASALAVPTFCKEHFELADRVAPRGGRIHPQVSSREFGSLLSFQTNLPFDSLPVWKEMRAKPLETQRTILADPENRRLLVAEAERGEYRQGIGAEPRPPVWDRMRTYDPSGSRGASIAELAASRRQSPVEVIIDLSIEHDLDIFFIQPASNFDDKQALLQLRHPRGLIALSDTGAHVSQICDTSIPTYFLAHWVRDRQMFSWEEGIRKLTLDPALVMGFHDRGILREGFVADITVIDPERLSPGWPKATRDLPAGGLRLVQKAEGISATLVRGEPLTIGGEHTGAMPGQLLRSVAKSQA